MSIEDDCSSLFGVGKRLMGEGQRAVVEMLEARERPPTTISSRAERYKKAAETYRKIIHDELASEMKEILEFLSWEDWPFAIEMLRESEEEIRFGWQDGAHVDVGYYLCGAGFVRKYFDDGHMKTETLDPKNRNSLVEIAMAFHHQNEGTEVSFLDYIYAKLNEIAEVAEGFASDKK